MLGASLNDLGMLMRRVKASSVIQQNLTLIRLRVRFLFWTVHFPGTSKYIGHRPSAEIIAGATFT